MDDCLGEAVIFQIALKISGSSFFPFLNEKKVSALSNVLFCFVPWKSYFFMISLTQHIWGSYRCSFVAFNHIQGNRDGNRKWPKVVLEHWTRAEAFCSSTEEGGGHGRAAAPPDLCTDAGAGKILVLFLQVFFLPVSFHSRTQCPVARHLAEGSPARVRPEPRPRRPLPSATHPASASLMPFCTMRWLLSKWENAAFHIACARPHSYITNFIRMLLDYYHYYYFKILGLLKLILDMCPTLPLVFRVKLLERTTNID